MFATNRLLQHWHATAKRDPTQRIHLREAMTRVTLDIISLVAFGVDLNAVDDPSTELVTAITNIFHITEQRVFQQFPLHLLPFLPCMFSVRAD